jgi:hypothetical protein
VGAVVPGEELLAVGARILDAAETLGEIGTIFERFELSLGVRNMWSATYSVLCCAQRYVADRWLLRLQEAKFDVLDAT